MKKQLYLALLLLAFSTCVKAQIFWFIDTIIVDPVYPTNTEIFITVEGEMHNDDFGISQTNIQTIGDSVFITIDFEFGYGSQLDDWSASFKLDSLPTGEYFIKCKASLLSQYGDVIKFKHADFLVSRSFGNGEFIQNDIELLLYPNPASCILNVEVESKSEFCLTIYRVSGEPVYTEYFTADNAYSTLTLSVEDYPSGTYFLEIAGKGYNKVSHFVIKK